MKGLVVVESMFGNSRTIGSAVAQGLARTIDVTVIGIAQAPAVLPSDIDLLVVGGPTHALGMSRPATRLSAREQGSAEPAGTGMREWLTTLPGRSIAAAAFDTRMPQRFVTGSAARGAFRRLRRLGFALLAPAESFFVTGTAGPLRPGEVERARAWGEELARGLSHSEQRVDRVP